MDPYRVTRRLPLLSSLLMAILIVAVAAFFSYRDHMAFARYARLTAETEGKSLVTGLHNWVERVSMRELTLEAVTNATMQVCRNSSARIYSFLAPNMEMLDAGLDPMPLKYLRELEGLSFPTNGPRRIIRETGDGRYLLFISPVFPNVLGRTIRNARKDGIKLRTPSNAMSLDAEVYFDGDKTVDDSIAERYWGDQLTRKRNEIRHFCRLLTGRSCQSQLKRLGDDLPLAIIGLPSTSYTAYLNPRRSQLLIFLSVLSVVTFGLIFFGGMMREKRSIQESLRVAQEENDKLQAEKLFSDRLATIGRAAAAIAHDLRNPLSSIRGFIELFAKHAKETGDSAYASHTDVMLREIDRLNGRITGILNFARPETLNLERKDISEALGQLQMLEEGEARAHGVDLVLDLGKNLRPVLLDEGVFLRAALNLCVNAFDAMPYGGELRILARDGGQQLVLTFIDNGEGIAPEMLEHLFDPFITSKAEGSGLGLASVEKAVTAHKGTIAARNVAGGGAAFEIRLPYAPEEK